MERLSEQEISCLKAIASGQHEVISPCPEPLIQHLESLGLIVFETQWGLPLEMVHSGYQLTSAGWTTLRKEI